MPNPTGPALPLQPSGDPEPPWATSRFIADLQQDYDETVGRRACLFVDAARVDPGAHLAAEWVAATIEATLPPERTLAFDKRAAIRSQIVTHAVVGGASFQRLETVGRLRAAAGPRLARLTDALVRPDGNSSFGLIVCNVDGVVTPFEHIATAQLGGARLCGPAAAADLRATRLFVFHHEGKHSEHRLAPRIRQHHRPLLSRPFEMTGNQREVEADLHGVAMAVTHTGLPLATAVSDVRAIEFAVNARGGRTGLEHWTCWALDRLTPDLDGLVTHRPMSSRDCGDLLDGTRAGLDVPERERFAAEYAFWSAHQQLGKASLVEFLGHAAMDQDARPYAERCLEAVARSLDTGFLDAFEAASFTVVDGSAGCHTICVDGEAVLSGHMSEDDAGILGGILRHGRIDRLAEIVACADVMGVPEGAGVAGFRGPAITLLRRALRHPGTVQALLAAAVRVEDVIESRVLSRSTDAGRVPRTP